ncbi:MAG TPA: ribosome biogenesis GTPase Der [Acidobacteriota bacterium]|nr:ribosome biogenesis GTPase Der [Acidobacteriota bacterium]
MFRVAIVGRPNVGKSTLFNRLTQTRKAIVGNEPGITRDRLYEIARWDQKEFEVIDTGGMIPGESDIIPEQILEQARLAMTEADLILFVVDVRAGITPLDEALNSLIRSTGKDYLVVVNKVDTPRLEDDALQFYAFGVDSIYPISAEHKEGVSELLEDILVRVPEGTATEPAPDEIRVAIIGRPNVGKSSLLNRFLGQERAIVTDIPGTTRDSVDSTITFDGQTYRLIDTAGIRRKGKTELMAEKLSVIMARKSLERADVALLLLDATEGATHLDATIGGCADEAGVSVVIVVNKWDLVERDTFTAQKLEEEFREKMRFLDYAPMAFVSAKTGLRVAKLLQHVRKAYEARSIRIPTAELNEYLGTEVQPSLLRGKGRQSRFPLKYAVQVGTAPPTVVVFVRGGEKLHFSTERFLINQLRERYEFYATPIRIVQRVRSRAKARNRG